NEILLRGGIGFCAHCKRRIGYFWHEKSNRYYYKCANVRDPVSPCPSPFKYTISATRIDNAAWEWFIMKVSQPETLRAAYENYQRNFAKMRQAEVAHLEAMKSLLAEAENSEQEYLLALGHAGSEAIRLKLLGLAEEAHELAESRQKEVRELEQALSHSSSTAAMMQAIETMTPDAVRTLQAVTDTEDKRTALYLFQVRAWIWGKQYDPEVEFTWLGEGFEYTSTRG
ncbi:MAG TPA: hypothetical protein VFX24_00015, partial [Ktedonobacterales bacterium]|nr:hypothetical protein [Ktedonobacterales bacterium]